MRKKNYRYCRHPRTTAERKSNQERLYVRAKRCNHNLPDSWEDIPLSYTKSWKDKRKKQYRVGKRGKKHKIFLEANRRIYFHSTSYNLEQYFKKHGIPCRITEVYKPDGVKKRTVTEDGTMVYGDDRSHQIGWTWTYKMVPLDKPKEYSKKKTKFAGVQIIWKKTKFAGVQIIWWSDKDIDIEKVIDSCTERW